MQYNAMHKFVGIVDTCDEYGYFHEKYNLSNYTKEVMMIPVTASVWISTLVLIARICMIFFHRFLFSFSFYWENLCIKHVTRQCMATFSKTLKFINNILDSVVFSTLVVFGKWSNTVFMFDMLYAEQNK